MFKGIMCSVLAIGIFTLGIVAAAASSAAAAGIAIKGDTALFTFQTTDRDMAVLDRHPGIKLFGNAGEAWSGFGPIPPLAISDAGLAHLANCKELKTLRLISIHPIKITDAGTTHGGPGESEEAGWMAFARSATARCGQ